MYLGKKYELIGVMSGTSLDGVDIVKCNFFQTHKWDFQIEKAETIPYSKEWLNKLQTLHSKPKRTIIKEDQNYGKYLGRLINSFVKKYNLKVDYVSSHGHTIFHQPENGKTLQIGNGNTLASTTKKITITDFRTMDVSLGGQGAPLVPIGDLYLFPEYKYCLNLGGFGNISKKTRGKIIAFDICPVNFVLNYLSKKLHKDYDESGLIAKSGRLDKKLLYQLNSLDFYKRSYPKSLSREWVERNIFPLIESRIPLKDFIRTFCEHIACQIGKHLKNQTTLITGGGVFNNYLISRIKHYSRSKIIIPSEEIINFKEALIFSFLGMLRLKNEINCLSSVTGSKKDTSSGRIFTF